MVSFGNAVSSSWAAIDGGLTWVGQGSANSLVRAKEVETRYAYIMGGQ